MKISVNYYSVTPQRFIAGTAGSYGFEKLDAEFSSEWDGLSKKFVFYPPTGKSVSVLYSGEPIDIPIEVMSARGVTRFAVVGYEGERTLVTVTGELDVLWALDPEAENAQTPTPSEISQVLEIMERNTAISESVREDADNGVFNGRDGVSAGFGVPRVSVTALEEGSEPTVNVSAEGEDTAKVFAFDFGLPTAKVNPVKRYSVRFSGSAAAGVREDDAVGMVAQVAVGDESVENDFDGVAFFNRPICNCVWNAAERRWIVKAYLGEPDFDWYGGNGEVMYECTPFYYKADFEESSAPTYVSVTATPLEGYSLAPMFKNGRDKVYCPCFNMALYDGIPVSRAGMVPSMGSMNDLVQLARVFDEGASLETVENYFSDCLLLWVEFATKSWKSVMKGAAELSYETDVKIREVISDTSFRTNGTDFIVGQQIAIGKSSYSDGIIASAEIISISEASEGLIINLDTSVSNMAVGYYVSSRMFKTGKALLSVTNASSGSPNSNTDGKNPCVWRGKENPWCNGYSWISNLLVKRYGSNTSDDPYVYKLQYLPDPSLYASGEVTEDYLEMNFSLANSNGVIKTLSVDSRYPFVFGPTETAFSTALYFTSYYYYPQYEVVGVRIGGDFSNGKNGGLLFDTSMTPSSLGYGNAARFFVKS